MIAKFENVITHIDAKIACNAARGRNASYFARMTNGTLDALESYLYSNMRANDRGRNDAIRMIERIRASRKVFQAVGVAR